MKKSKTPLPTAHIPCGSQTSVLEEAHGICALAGCLYRFITAQLLGIVALRKDCGLLG